MSWNQSVVTNAGVGLLNESLAGHTLTIESAVGGAGTLTEEELAAATDVVDQKQTFSLLGIEDIEGGKRVGIQITNKGVSEPYILHQIGVKARLEYEGAPLTLLIILQDEHGVEIPTEAENPDWLFEIYAVISISNKAHITVNIDTSAIASLAYVKQELGKKADLTLSNLDTPQVALRNLGAGVRKNLLVNPYFTGGSLPINQRGKSSYSGNGSKDVYSIDMWKVTSDCKDLTIGQDGLSITSIIPDQYPVFQELEGEYSMYAGKAYTVSALMGDGTLISGTGVFPASTPQESMALVQSASGAAYDIKVFYNLTLDEIRFGFYANAGSANAAIQACKLEEGEGQTLGYQDSTGAWHLLPQPDDDYQTQLNKCQYYLKPLSGIYAGGTSGSSETIIGLYIPGKMRTKPVVTGVTQVGDAYIAGAEIPDSIVYFGNAVFETLERGDGYVIRVSQNTNIGVLKTGKVGFDAGWLSAEL